MSENITNTSIMSEEIANDVDSIYFTKAGIIIPMVTGSISFLSSMIIISIVMRSMSGIKTTYHRIILFMSSADCLTSLMIALTTMPMPKDVIYPFQMPSYGNIATCEAQGFIFMMGNGLAFCMNGILNIYYLCTLRYNMTEKTFRCYLEIPLFIVSLAIFITLPSIALINQELNPDPTDPYCVPITYPVDCTKADNPECRGEGGRDTWYPATIAVGSLSFFTLMITMALVVHSFYRNERKLRKAVRDNHIKEGDEAYADLQYAQWSSGIITRQALMYIAAFFITWIFGLVQISFFTEPNDTLFVLRMIFQPLQGFFNLIIFAYHKIYIVLISDEDVSFAEAVGIVFLHPDKMKELVFTLDLDLEDDDISICAPRNNHDAENDRSQVLSGFEDVFRDAGAGAEIEFDKPNMANKSPIFISSGGWASIGEERSITYEYYDNVGHNLEDLPDNVDENLEDLPRLNKSSAMESEDDVDGDISMISKDTNDDGISFLSTSINTPLEVTKEAFKDNDSANHLFYPLEQSMLSRRVMIEADLVLNYAESEKQAHNLSAQPLSHPHATPAVDSWLETNIDGGQSSRHDIFAKDGGINNLNEDNEWSVSGAESFAEDSADLRYAQMKEIIAAKSLAASAALSKGNGGTRWRSLFLGKRKK